MHDLLPTSPKPWEQHLGNFISESRVDTDAVARPLLVVRTKHPSSNLQVAHICYRDARATRRVRVETAKPEPLRGTKSEIVQAQYEAGKPTMEEMDRACC